MRLTHLAVVMTLAVPGGARAQAPTTAWGELLVPGGVQAARRSFGMTASDNRPESLFLLDFADRFVALRNYRVLQGAGRYFRALANPGASVPPPDATSQPASVLPLPAPMVWDALGVPGDSTRIATIVEREDLTLLYRGLMSLDDETLQVIAGTPALVRSLQTYARLFAVFGRSLRVRDAQVLLPGGEECRDVWQRLTKQDPSDPSAFVSSLLAADDGRLVYFFDAVWRMDAARQGAVLGVGLAPDVRVRHVDAVYRVFRQFEPLWTVRDEPFQLRAFDPAVALTMLDVGSDGMVGPEWWPPLLERVVDTDSWPDRSNAGTSLRPQQADVRWVLEWLFREPNDARPRFEMLRYLQRQFVHAESRDAVDLETALRTVREMPSLALSLERMGVRNASLVGALGRRARQLTRSGRSEDVEPRLVRWQSAFGWLEQVHRHQPIESSVLEALLAALAEDPGRTDNGAVPTWIVEELLPALGAGAANMAESELLARMLDAGPAATTVSWEGLIYDLRPGRAALRSVLAVRGVQAGPRLDQLVALVRSARRLATTPDSLDTVRDVAADLQTRLPAIQAMVDAGVFRSGVTSDLQRVIGTLSGIERQRDLERATRERQRLLWIADQITSVLGPQVLYALAAAPTAASPLMYADAWRQHRLSVASLTETRSWTALVWDTPHPGEVPVRDAGLQGSFIGVDLAIGEAELRETDGAPLLAPPVLAGADRAAMVQSLRLARPVPDSSTAEASHILASTAAGRTVLHGWQLRPEVMAEARARLEQAGVEERRINLLLWAATRGEPLDGWLGPSELYRLGGGADLSAFWGVAGRAVDGCWCYEPHAGWRSRWLSDRAGSGFAGAAVMDLSLRMAEHLAALDLPPSLTAWLVRSGMRDWVDAVWQNIPSDAAALAEFPARVPLDRLDEYLLALVADGFLVVTGGGAE